MSYRINHLAVWLLVIAHQAIGALWYAEWALGGLWLDLRGLTMQDLEWDPLPFVIGVAAAVATNYALAWLLIAADAMKQPGRALGMTLLVFLSLVLAEVATHYAFLDVPLLVIPVDMGKSLIAFLLSAAVLSSWPRVSASSAGSA